MKNNYLLTTQLIIVGLVANLITISAQIELDCDGNVGIGGDPGTEKLYLEGTMRFHSDYSDLFISPTGGYFGVGLVPESNNYNSLGTASKAFHEIWVYEIHDQQSDSTQKENIRDLENALDIISGLRGIRFDFKKEAYYNNLITTDPVDIERMERERKNRIGFIGQEMIHVLPEAVFIDDSTGIYTIDYTRVIPVLVNAMQEQQAIINYLTTEVELLKSNEQLKNTGTKSITDEFENTGKSSLAQNLPNPFTESTIIEYFLSEDVNDAKIYIYNMNGKQLKSYDLYLKGNGNITINGGEFSPGMYMYTLITDGQVIDTKRMILTD